MHRDNRRAISEDLNKFCHMAKKDSFIEVTQWTNQDGYDITIDNKNISLTEGEITGIRVLSDILKYEVIEE